MSRARRAYLASRRWLWRMLPAITVGLVALYLIWPVPKGQMPLSADHNVHVARAAMLYDKLMSGHLTGWSSNWFFGFPLGELYPPMGDYAVVLVRLLSFGALDFGQCYAFVFAAVYVFQAVVMIRVSRCAGMHPVAGMLAGLLILYDAGVLREGGWRYTVYYGVWLQPMACAFLWWALAETNRLVRMPLEGTHWLRRAALPAVLYALALLSHPIALPTLAVALTLLVLFLGVRSTAGLGPVTLRVGVVFGLGLLLSLWWIGPLFANRHWIATFGTLYSHLGTMLGRVLEGQFARHMASGVGYGIVVGLLWSWIRGNRFAKFTATASVVLWMMSTSDFFWLLRLDWIHEGFLHMQYQRFIICAKPGLFLGAGFAVVGLVKAAWRTWEAGERSRRAGIRMFAKFAAGTGVLVWMLSAAYAAADKHGVGEVQLDKLTDKKRADAFAKELDQFCKWSKSVWDDREEFFRFAYKTRRHSHVYMDASVCNGAPAYKVGYMPGEVFVHRPESAKPEIFQHLRVKYSVEGKRRGRSAKPVVTFGKIHVYEQKLEEGVARIEGGAGEVEVLLEDPDVQERVEIEVR
ncbi:MAG: hypothetical protein KDK70_40220, partial [Myxococcales bacterium]|nr:hypothetical protein [Myxococcales bacterium]